MGKGLDEKTDSLGSRASEAFAADPTDAAGQAANDRLAYMADLLLELKDMATADGHATLAGLLALAHTEALLRRR